MTKREEVYAALTREDEYAKGWSKGKKSAVEGIPDHFVTRNGVRAGLPYSEIEWINFAEKYIQEVKEAHANFVPDRRALQIRILKAASMLVAALQTSSTEQDLLDIAGKSSTDFPTMRGGLKNFLNTEVK